ncbi:SMC-Scp complex subunit ScpB [Acidiphilium iwatense]|uniref:SMC-Scp complex subunit ScpB n=1 Tax=Acidiphilium iwatense TaxID=768198 RepID=A0ABS9DSS5_9PROT|nr:SMC-Scp complex subunit ScpB [Acidiphilium iwatense]MCF3945788.1 SMC-Scp complex subunit ScpB [Acidiphilium iwatense]
MAAFEVPIEVLRLAEALVFASPEPVTPKTLEPLLPRDLDPLFVLEALQRHCADRGVILVQTGGGWSFRTAPDLAAPLREVLTETRRLPRVAMETLVVIALHQPITRANIENIRGASLGQATMDLLLETGLIQPWGRKEASGRPTLWVTTPRFLAQFGLNSLRDLPGAGRAPLQAEGRPKTTAAPSNDSSAADSDGAATS